MAQETPWASSSDQNCWQYSPASGMAAGAEISTDQWPHESMIGLDSAAREILEFFRYRQRSRMTLKPIRDGLVFLDDGLSGPTQPNIKIGTAA
jgi:hypothetical protein